jgi:hypothetical protein
VKPVAAGREERVGQPAKPAKAAREERPPQVAAVKEKQLPMALPTRRERPTPSAPAAPAPKEAAATANDRPPAAAKSDGEEQVASRTGGEAPAQPAATPAEERFVPVLFTHKDHATVEQAMADLKKQYPSLLIGRKGEIQPLNLGEKGIWHRLVFLPAGPRPEAARLCDQLLARGYDRCWVKAY